MKRTIFLTLFFVTASLLFSQTSVPKWITEHTSRMVAVMETELKLTKEQSAIVAEIVLAKRIADLEANKSQMSDEEKKAKIRGNFNELKAKLESKLNVGLTTQILKFMREYNAKNHPPKPAQ
jgi:uncharacterized membrane-anchored protein YjiN (DUF445 family)